MPVQDLRDADAAWVEALLARDGSAASKILHDEFSLVLVHPGPARVERDEWLRTLAGYVFHAWSVRQSAWDVRPDLAVHLQLIEQHATVLGTDRSGLFSVSDTWLRDGDGAWRVWRRHSTPLAAGAMPRS